MFLQVFDDLFWGCEHSLNNLIFLRRRKARNVVSMTCENDGLVLAQVSRHANTIVAKFGDDVSSDPSVSCSDMQCIRTVLREQACHYCRLALRGPKGAFDKGFGYSVECFDVECRGIVYRLDGCKSILPAIFNRLFNKFITALLCSLLKNFLYCFFPSKLDKFFRCLRSPFFHYRFYNLTCPFYNRIRDNNVSGKTEDK